ANPPSPATPALSSATGSAQIAGPDSEANASRDDTVAANEVRHGDRIKISGAARELAGRIASSTEANETAVRETVESRQQQIEREQVKQEQLAAPNKQPPVNQATQKTITTRIDVVA
ncbi:MAG: hypothetical protein R8L58_05585, partial [Mariprofundaceae bacterium]